MPERDRDGNVIITPIDLWQKLDRLDHKFEQFKWQIIGGATVVSVIFGALAGSLANYIMKGN